MTGSIGRWLDRFLGQMSQVGELATAAEVARLVPPTAEYVSCGPVRVVPDVVAFNRGAAGRGRQGRDLGFLDEQQRIALLVLADDRLRVIESTGESWSRAVRTLTDVDAHRGGGFLVFCDDGSGLAVGTQTPVQLAPGSSTDTPRGMTNAFSGWDAVLAPYGVQRHF